MTQPGQPAADHTYEGHIPMKQLGQPAADHTYESHIPMKQPGHPVKPTIKHTEDPRNNCRTSIIVCIVLSIFGIATALLILFGVVLATPG